MTSAALEKIRSDGTLVAIKKRLIKDYKIIINKIK